MKRSFRLLACALLVGPVACATAVADTDAGDDPYPVQDSGYPHADGANPVADSTAPPAADAAGVPDAAVPPVDSGGPAKDAAPVGDGGACSASGILAKFDFTGEPGNQVSTAAASAVAGLTAGAISRSSKLAGNAGVNSMNSNNWSISAQIDMTRYLTFTVTPDPKCKLDLSSASIDTKTSALGPAAAAIATSADSFVTLTKFVPGNGISSVSLSVAAATGPVEVRVYGYAAIDVSGTMRAQNTLSVSGTLK